MKKFKRNKNEKLILEAIYNPAPLKEGVHPDMLKRKGGACDENYVDNLKKMLKKRK